MKNFVHIGDSGMVAAPATIISRELVILGSLFGTASTEALTGERVTLSSTGVFEMAKGAADNLSIGDILCDDDASDLVTTMATENTKVGLAVEDAGKGVGTVRVRLSGAF